MAATVADKSLRRQYHPVKNVTDRVRDPFDLAPPCDEYVPGFGDVNADFHVIGDHPGIHGGATSQTPFADSDSGRRLQSVLKSVGLLEEDTELRPQNVFFSYLHMCVPDTEPPSAASYSEMERFFDAELRAITAHVLLPVGDTAIRHVLKQFTTYPLDGLVPKELHATEISSGAWLVVPIAEPSTWSAEDEAALTTVLQEVLGRDYKRESDLGRFLTGGDPYLVR